MYFSGVFFDVVKRIPGVVGMVLEKVNPMAFYISSVRDALIYGRMPSLLWLGIWTGISLLLIMYGIHLVYKYQDGYAKII